MQKYVVPFNYRCRIDSEGKVVWECFDSINEMSFIRAPFSNNPPANKTELLNLLAEADDDHCFYGEADLCLCNISGFSIVTQEIMDALSRADNFSYPDRDDRESDAVADFKIAYSVGNATQVIRFSNVIPQPEAGPLE